MAPALRSFFQDPPECGPADAKALCGTGLVHIFFVQDAVDDVRFDLFEGAAQIKVLRRFMTLLGLQLAIIAAMTNSNGGLYTALAGEYGDSSDVGALAVLAINDGPFLTMVAFGATGLADIPLIDLVACVVPLVIGFILGNLDEDLRHFLGSQMNLLIPFFAFPLGASLNFRTIINAGAPGLILGVVVTIITGFGGNFVSRVYGKKMKPAAAAIGSTAGNAAATPNAIAASDASLAPYAAAATAQVAAAVIVTAVLCPLLTSYLAKRAKGENKETA